MSVSMLMLSRSQNQITEDLETLRPRLHLHSNHLITSSLMHGSLAYKEPTIRLCVSKQLPFWKMRATVTFYICLFLYCGQSSAQFPTEISTGLTREEKQSALDLHNDLRRQEGASDMLLMVLK